MGTHSSGCRYATVWRKFGVNSEVDKWFSNARHGFRAYEKVSSNVGTSSSNPARHSKPVKETKKKSPGGSIRKKRTISSQTTRRMKPVNKKLHVAFEENQYPSREKNENLAQELGMTFYQISQLESMQFEKSSESTS